MLRAVLFASATLAFTTPGCPVQWADEPKAEPFEVQINVVSDPGVPLPGAQVSAVSNPTATTDANGSARVLLRGREGDRVEVSTKCPADYQPPEAPLSIGLRRLSKGSPLPLFEVRCPPTRRTIIVGIRAENGPNLPVQYLGRTMTRTDASGAALFALKVRPAEQVDVTVNTTDSPDGLKPPNPTFTFVSKDVDDFVVFDQTFTIPVKHHVAHVILGPKPL